MQARNFGKKITEKTTLKSRILKNWKTKTNGPKFMLVIWLRIPLCTTLCLYHRPKAMSFWGSWVEKFHSSLALLYATASTGDHNSGWPQKQLLAISSYILWCRSPLTISCSTQLSIWKKCCLIYHSLGIVICFFIFFRRNMWPQILSNIFKMSFGGIGVWTISVYSMNLCNYIFPLPKIKK